MKETPVNSLLGACEDGDQDACLQLKFGKEGSKLRYMAGGGLVSSLLNPKESTQGNDLVFDNDLDPSLLPFSDMMSEEELTQLEAALDSFPIVRTVVELATNKEGEVDGPGGPTEDKVPAMLSDGEFVLPSSLVDEIGRDNLEALLEKHMQQQAAM